MAFYDTVRSGVVLLLKQAANQGTRAVKSAIMSMSLKKEKLFIRIRIIERLLRLL